MTKPNRIRGMMKTMLLIYNDNIDSDLEKLMDYLRVTKYKQPLS